MKKIYYNVAVGLTIINLIEVAIRKFTNLGSILPAWHMLNACGL